MNTKAILIFIICCSTLVIPVTSAAQQNSSSTVTHKSEQLFKEMVFKQKLLDTPEELHQQFSQNPFGLPEAKNKKMMDLFLKSFSGHLLLMDARAAFQQNINAQYIDSTLQWIQKPTTQTMVTSQKEFYTLQGIRKRIVHTYELEQKPAADARRDIIQNLEQHTSATESEIDSKVIIFRALVSAFDEMNTQQSFTEAQLNGIVSNYRSQLQNQLGQEIHDQLLLMYFEVDNNTIQHYGAFFERPSGRWLQETISTSIHAAYQAAAERFLDSLQYI